MPMPKIRLQQPHFIMQNYYKEFATVNGNVVQDKEIKSVSNEKERIIMGHNGPYPIYEKQLFFRNPKKSMKSLISRKHMKRKSIKKRTKKSSKQK